MSAGAKAIEAKSSGVYCTPKDTAALPVLRKAAAKAGALWLELPLEGVANKQQFFAVCTKQLKLPSYFGGNWDALADCVRDFNWLAGKGYVLCLSGQEKFAKAAPDDYQTALDVFAEAADFWKGRGTPFIVLVEGAKDLPVF